MFCGMDEGLLNDLLECSVCLERLDTSSRVLPCQHTFCLKCLKVIVESHKELRCPECRILVEAKVEELPPNVLLMRILEGMKNSSTPRKLAGGTSAQRARAAQLHQLQAQQQASQHASHTVRGSDGKPLPPHARAIHDFRSKELGDLSFKKGETIMLQKRVDAFWFHGECSGRSGLFPINYVQVVVPLPVATALCKALYDFRMSAPDEEGCLAFDKGAIITVHRRVDENWAEGRIEDRVGIFPIAFVELNNAATALMNSPTLNRPVPPLPEQARPSHSDHRHLQHQQHRYQQMSISTPTPAQSTYQNITPMAQSQPIFNQTRTMPQPALLSRNILEPQTKHLDLIHLTNMTTQTITGPQTISGPQTMSIQSVSRINDNIDRLRASKYENYSTPRKSESTYQNVKVNEHFPVAVANFNANNSDSSSSVNTNSIGAGSTSPNSSSNTRSTESAVPSLPSSPENADRNTTVTQSNTTQNSTETEQESQELNNSIGTLSLNESSTATNTSLNVSLPPTEVENQTVESQEGSNKIEPNRLNIPSSSKGQILLRSGPDSLLNFGLGLQAALSPSHAKEYVSRGQREKRHSLTPSTHLNANPSASQNRHSAEILATSLLDHMPERDRNKPDREKERERRRRRSRSNERPLPATYVAMYPYKPRKPDELQLNKGEVYIVVERCRDGWYKGAAATGGGPGLFPGNYVSALPPPRHLTPRTRHDKVPSHRSLSPATSGHPVGNTSQPQGPLNHSSGTNSQPPGNQSSSSQPSSLIGLTAPDAPPRALSPNTNTVQAQSTGYPWAAWSDNTPKSEKPKDKTKGEKSQSTGVSLMKRLAAMKKCKSPPPTYSMDNPVFDEGPGTSAAPTVQPPVHVRSGSCPSQLLRALPATVEGRSASHRLRVKERPSVLPAHEHHGHASSPWHAQTHTQHKKSQSLDVTTVKRDRDRHHSQPSKERFRCIVPYPPNSEYELELKVDDIVLVHRKRGDGWYKGTLQRTGRTGLFPASFVQSCPAE